MCCATSTGRPGTRRSRARAARRASRAAAPQLDARRRRGRGRRSARACRSAARSSAGSRCPAATTGAPSRSSQARRVVEPLPDEPLERGVAARALAPELVEVAGSARRRRSRGASTRPGRSPFSSTTVSAPSSRARPPRRGRAMPAPATVSGAQRRENEALCSTYSSLTRSGPQTKTANVFGASTTSATSTPSSCAGAGRVDEHAEVVEQRPLGLAGVALRRSSRNAPPTSTLARAGRREARTGASRGGGLGVGREERDVVEVVLDLGRALDEGHPEPLADVEDLRRPGRKQRASGREVGDAQADVRERPGLARALGVEQRQLAAPRVGADEREALGPLDHVHAEVARREVGDADRGRRPRVRRGRDWSASLDQLSSQAAGGLGALDARRARLAGGAERNRAARSSGSVGRSARRRRPAPA